jgi:hypothetical protein
VCEGLLFRIFRRPNRDDGNGFAVVFTAAHPGAGVSHVTNALALALEQGGLRFTVLRNGSYLAPGDAESSNLAKLSESRNLPRLWQECLPHESRDNGRGLQSRLGIYLKKLRREYRYILIDCPSLREAEHAVVLSPLVDGVVLIVEGNRTKRDQLSYSERTIESAGGQILGHVLNKRTYVIPDWLHRKMEAVGI